MRASPSVLLLLLFLLLTGGLGACKKAPPPPQPPPGKPAFPSTEFGNARVEPRIELDNLLDLGMGVSVVSRTGELHLDVSAANVIDGMYETTWISAPGASDEQIVFSLLAPARVQRVGMTTAPEQYRPDSVRFEGSADGKRWEELATIVPVDGKERQLVSLAKPALARFIRVTARSKERYYIGARTFQVLGEEVAPPETPPLAGCWTINGTHAFITQDGARITGVIEHDPPIFLDGGTNDRVALVNWIQGPARGYAAITRSNDGKHLTGITFHEEIQDHFAGEGWFGRTCRDPVVSRVAAPKEFLERAGRYSIYGLAFDSAGQLDEELSAPALDAVARLFLESPQQRFRITSREFRSATPALNARHTAARLTALRNALRARKVDTSRLELVAAGDQWIGPPITSPIQLLLACRIDIEKVGR